MNEDFDEEYEFSESDEEVKPKEEDIQFSKQIEKLQSRDTFLPKHKLFEPIGILDPEGLQLNPLNGKPYSDRYRELARKAWSNLPMYRKEEREKSILGIYENQVLLIISGTGSGKTVFVPKFALHALNYKAKIGITNPKISPTDKNADFAYKCLDVEPPSEDSSPIGIGHSNAPKKDIQTSNVLLNYVTDGTINANLEADPLLLKYDCIIIDEAHERNKNIDMMIYKLKKVLLKRKDFKLIIMSATIDKTQFMDYFQKDHIKMKDIEVPGKENKPIEEFFLDDLKMKNIGINPVISLSNSNNAIVSNIDYVKDVVKVAMFILKEYYDKRSILIFIGGKAPGMKIVKELLDNIEKNSTLKDKVYVNFLAGGSKTSEKDMDIMTNATYTEIPEKQYIRQIIISTEVAESSMTFTDLDFVIDTGIVHKNKFYYDEDCEKLEPNIISQASHEQRKGRVGRTEPGFCFNLFTRKTYEKFPKYIENKIQLEDASSLILQFFNKEEVSHLEFDPYSTNKVNYNTKNKHSLNYALSELIEPIREENLVFIIKKMYALKFFYIRGDPPKGYINNLGLIASKMDKITDNLCLRKMLILGKLYNCLFDICYLVAFLKESSEISSLFSIPDIKKEPDPKKVAIIKKQFKEKFKQFVHPYGDCISIIELCRTYFSKERGSIDDKTLEVVSEGLEEEEFKAWKKINGLSNSKIYDHIKKSQQEIFRKTNFIIQDFIEEHSNKPLEELLENNKLIDTQDRETNLLVTINDSLFCNLIVNEHNTFSTLLFREHYIPKYKYIFTHLHKSSLKMKLSREYFVDDKDFFDFLKKNYNWNKKDIHIVEKREKEEEKTNLYSTGKIKGYDDSKYIDIQNFYNPNNLHFKFLTYLKQDFRMNPPKFFSFVTPIPENIMNILKSCSLEPENRAIFFKANIPVKKTITLKKQNNFNKENSKKKKKNNYYITNIYIYVLYSLINNDLL